MKKKLLTLGIALTTALSLTACTGNNEKTVSTSEETVVETKDTKTEKDKGEKDKGYKWKPNNKEENPFSAIEEYFDSDASLEDKNTKTDMTENKPYEWHRFSSLKEYYDSDDFQNGIKQASDTVKDQIDLKVSLEGYTLVYTYTYLEQMEVNKEAVSAVEEALDSQKGTLELIYEETNKAVKDAKDMKIKYEYLNKDGSVIFEKTYDFAK